MQDTVKYVQVAIDIDCVWQGLPPAYRLYVNDELFSERTWIWTDYYINEIIQVSGPPGTYTVRLEHIKPCLAKFKLGETSVIEGPAQWINNTEFKIL